MKIRVKTNFLIKGIDKEGFNFEGPVKLGEVLAELAGMAEYPLIDPDGKIGSEVDVSLNGMEYGFLQHKLDTELQENDEVEIMMLAIGGG